MTPSPASAVTPPASTTPSGTPTLSLPATIARGALGGVLMGLANLVPGISGGTMLVVAGIFTIFIASIAEVTSFRLRKPPMRAVITLASVIIPAGLAVLLLAGDVRNLVVDHRWVMYSLFIGWTLGGVPTVWAMARGAAGGPPGLRVWAGVGAGLLIMIAMVIIQNTAQAAQTTQPDAGGSTGPGTILLFLGGAGAAAAMVLPGLSGAYLLLLLGVYIPILDAIDQFKIGLQARDISAMLPVLWVVIPVGLGVIVGIVGVSHLVRWLLQRFEQATMGVLLGLLLGAFLGLYPFQQPVPPAPGTVIKGQAVTREALDRGDIKAKDWPTQYFAPTPSHIGISVLLIVAAASSTMLIARVGRRKPAAEVQPAAVKGG